jgi:hypothetical protein
VRGAARGGRVGPSTRAPVAVEVTSWAGRTPPPGPGSGEPARPR